MKRKILLYADININQNKEDAGKLFSLAKLLAKDNKNIVDILLKTKTEKSNIDSELKEYANITLLNAEEYISSCEMISFSNVRKVIKKIDEYRDYSCLLIDGAEITNELLKESSLSDKILKVDKVNKEEYDAIEAILNKFPMKKIRLLITGHDLKFIKELYPLFEKEYDLKIEEQAEYMSLNKSKAKELLKSIDIIWCEWLLLNAKWYSINKYPHQKLIIRAHRFEVEKKYGYKVKWENVTKVITVAYYTMEQFIERFNIPREKVVVINNFINVDNYPVIKEAESKYNLAMIGIVPKRKGFDHAINILIKLKEKDSRYKLYIAGKKPEEFATSWNVPEEREYFEKIYNKIKENNLEDSVIFTGWVKTTEFLKKIGYVLSLSDLVESFHIAPFEGMASNAVGMALDWDGIEYIYPKETIYTSEEEITNKILEYNSDDEKRENDIKTGREFVKQNYDLPIIWDTIYNLIENGGQE